MTTNANRPAYRIETIDEDGNVARTRTLKPTDADENDVLVRIGRAHLMRNTRVTRLERHAETVIHDRTD